MSMLITLIFAFAGALTNARWFSYPNQAELKGFFATCLFYISYLTTFQLMRISDTPFTVMQVCTVLAGVVLGAYIGRQRRPDAC